MPCECQFLPILRHWKRLSATALSPVPRRTCSVSHSLLVEVPLFRVPPVLIVEVPVPARSLFQRTSTAPIPNSQGGASFLEFARTLAAPDVAYLLLEAEPQSRFASFRFSASRRCRHERIKRFPANFLIFGDALCSFNPIYGQGMTVAALQALALRSCLAGGSKQLAQRFFITASSAIDVPWRIAAGNDLRHPRLSSRRMPGNRLLDWYVGKVHRAAAVTSMLLMHSFGSPTSSRRQAFCSIRA